MDYRVTARRMLAVVMSACVGAMGVQGVATSSVAQAAAPSVVIARQVTLKAAAATVKKRLVFAHYHLQYPISMENEVPSRDYYTKNYLSASGESGIYRDYGAYLRDRPVPQPPVASSNWELVNFEREIAYARRGGVDGFAVNVWPNAKLGDIDLRPYFQRAKTLVAAANIKKFRIMLQPDVGGSTPTYKAASLGKDLVELVHAARSGVIFKDSKGRVVVSPFAADANAPAYWRDVLNYMASKGVRAVLLPVFERKALTAKRFKAWKSISIGGSDWGGRNPGDAWSHADIMKKAGKLWMQPVSVQDARPHGSAGAGPNYEEAANSATLRANWNLALGAKKGMPAADLVLLVTWNDYGETTHFARSVEHGYSLLDMNKYFVAAYKAKKLSVTASRIKRERLFISHRLHTYAFKPKYRYPMVWRKTTKGTRPRNTVEVVTFLKSSAKVVVNIGTSKYRYTAKAGLYVKTFPLRGGYVWASFKRSGKTYKAATGEKVTNSRTLQDMGYLFASVAR